MKTNTPLTCGLYLISTPIGNLGDISERALATFNQLDLLLCEDTRVTRKLLSAYGAGSLALQTYTEHNAVEMHARVLDALSNGKRIGLVSDSGTPLLSDPGERLVQSVIQAGFYVSAVPGASAALTALCLSGLSTRRFYFAGFLPNKKGARRDELAQLCAIPGTLIFYESPHRLHDTLIDMVDILGTRNAAVARELTKQFEEVIRAPLNDLEHYYHDHTDIKGECVIIVAGASADRSTIDNTALLALLKTELKSRSVRDATALVAAQSGRPKKDIYALALQLSKEDE